MSCDNCKCTECQRENNIKQVCQAFGVSYSKSQLGYQIGLVRVFLDSYGNYLAPYDSRYYPSDVPELLSSINAANRVIEILNT